MKKTRIHVRKQVSLETKFAVVRNAINSLINRLMGGQITGSELTLLAEMLESLPMSSSEFGLARGRIQNSRRYLEAAEFGAARYELQLLCGTLRNCATIEPRRRRR